MSQTKQPGLAARVGAQDGFPPRPTARAKGEPPRREKQCQPCLPPSTAALHRPRCPLIPRARCLSREAEKAPQGEWSRATGGDRETAAGGGTGRCPGGGGTTPTACPAAIAAPPGPRPPALPGFQKDPVRRGSGEGRPRSARPRHSPDSRLYSAISRLSAVPAMARPRRSRRHFRGGRLERTPRAVGRLPLRLYGTRPVLPAPGPRMRRAGARPAPRRAPPGRTAPLRREARQGCTETGGPGGHPSGTGPQRRRENDSCSPRRGAERKGGEEKSYRAAKCPREGGFCC